MSRKGRVCARVSRSENRFSCRKTPGSAAPRGKPDCSNAHACSASRGGFSTGWYALRTVKFIVIRWPRLQNAHFFWRLHASNFRNLRGKICNKRETNSPHVISSTSYLFLFNSARRSVSCTLLFVDARLCRKPRLPDVWTANSVLHTRASAWRRWHVCSFAVHCRRGARSFFL